jgi:hypothetical protein
MGQVASKVFKLQSTILIHPELVTPNNRSSSLCPVLLLCTSLHSRIRNPDSPSLPDAAKSFRLKRLDCTTRPSAQCHSVVSRTCTLKKLVRRHHA